MNREATAHIESICNSHQVVIADKNRDDKVYINPADPENDELMDVMHHYPFDDQLIIAVAIKKVTRSHLFNLGTEDPSSGGLLGYSTARRSRKLPRGYRCQD